MFIVSVSPTSTVSSRLLMCCRLYWNFRIWAASTYHRFAVDIKPTSSDAEAATDVAPTDHKVVYKVADRNVNKEAEKAVEKIAH